MSLILRKYNVTNDFSAVSDFLNEQFLPDNKDGNFPQPAWEYIHGHPRFDETSMYKIGIWEDNGKIVGVTHYELALGEAFFQIHANYSHLKPAMLDYAEKHLYERTAEGRKHIKVWINDRDDVFLSLVKSRGYEKNDIETRPMSQLKTSHPFRPDTSIPDGFQLKSLEEDNDLTKLDRVLYRGFNYGVEPPAVEKETRLKARQKQQSMPGYQKDLNIVIEAPDGNFVALAGTWFVSENKYAYLEPVCTDPDFRRRGLGKAVVLEGLPFSFHIQP